MAQNVHRDSTTAEARVAAGHAFGMAKWGALIRSARVGCRPVVWRAREPSDYLALLKSRDQTTELFIGEEDSTSDLMSISKVLDSSSHPATGTGGLIAGVFGSDGVDLGSLGRSG